MTTRDKIIQILEKNYDSVYLITNFAKSVSEILALPLYEKEFVEWKDDLHISLTETNMDGIRKYLVADLGWERVTLDELHSYWLNNIKDKTD